MLSRRLAPLGVAALILAGCASDEAPADEISPDSVVEDGFDTGVDEGVETEVEQSENLGFDEPDEG